MVSVDYMVLADMATAAEGKLYIHGAGWDTLAVQSFPAVQLVMGVAIRFRVPWAETNIPWRVEIDLVDEDGQTLLPAPIVAELNSGRPPQLKPGSDQVLPLAAQMMNVQFQHPGTYAVVLRVNGEEEDRAPFNLLAAPGTNVAPHQP